ncbi:hypothetical protein P9911_008145 [Klebsiella oxytoca]|uniref:hypothetical protein n=1 Tax=Klebsiella oxytoca TaxID=571 RepID=UPI00254CFD5C|nr:hypothetical protein [Klebsiella oxytoca]MEC5505808.1 hypothetical protein [Klebsiella oxytoca]
MTYFTQVMPEHYSQLDRIWLEEKLESLPYVTRQRVAVEYSAVYQDAYETEPVSYRKENAARKAANKRLRIFSTRYALAAAGGAEKPLKKTECLDV